MATLTIRNLPDPVRERLRLRAAKRGHSMEAEAREVLAEATVEPGEQDTYENFVARVRQVQAAIAPFRDPHFLASDELIAERRAEAWKETVEAQDEANQRRLARRASEKLRL